MHPDQTASNGRLLPALVLLAAGLYALTGIIAMWLLSPRVPYADQWRFYRELLERPFSEYLFAADNGHREVLPKLVRWAEFEWFGADQNLQIVLAAVFALGTLGLLAGIAWRSPHPLATRVATILAAAVGVFWLGNERALTHSNDAIHAYLIILLLVCALALVARASPRGESMRAGVAMLCALAATFSFGSGIAVLPAMLLVLALRRAPVRAWLPAGAGLVLTLALYLADATQATTVTLRFDPLNQAVLLLHWLCAPLVYVFWPLLDVDIAALLPAGAMRSFAIACATRWTNVFGDIERTIWPQAGIGLAGLVAFGVTAWCHWRERAAATAATRIALGIAGFALAVGAIIALSRAEYFDSHPAQIQATRYLVWSSLFWTGLLMAVVLRARSPRRATGIVLAVALVVAPSEAWMGRLAINMRSAAEQVALGGVVHALDRDEALGETAFAELEYVLPMLEQRGKAMYAWPETAWLDRTPPASMLRRLDANALHIGAIDNRFDGPGARVELQIVGATKTRIFVLDASGRVIGLAQHYLPHGRNAWRGWMRRTPSTGMLTFAEIDG